MALLAYIRAHATEDRPLVPASWDVVIEADRWSSIYPLGRAARGVFFHARMLVRDPSFATTRALFVCTGPAGVLSRLADQIAADGLVFTRTWPSLPPFRSDASPVPARLRTAWPDDRARVVVGPPEAPVGGAVGPLIAHHRRMAGAAGEDAET